MGKHARSTVTTRGIISARNHTSNIRRWEVRKTIARGVHWWRIECYGALREDRRGDARVIVCTWRRVVSFRRIDLAIVRVPRIVAVSVRCCFIFGGNDELNNALICSVLLRRTLAGDIVGVSACDSLHSASLRCERQVKPKVIYPCPAKV